MNKDSSAAGYSEKVFFLCSSKKCTVKVSIRNFLKIPLHKNSLNTKGVINFLFNCYPIGSMCVAAARKWLMQEFNSKFDTAVMCEVFKKCRHLIAREMLKRNNKVVISGPCFLTVTHWSPSPIQMKPCTSIEFKSPGDISAVAVLSIDGKQSRLHLFKNLKMSDLNTVLHQSKQDGSAIMVADSLRGLTYPGIEF